MTAEKMFSLNKTSHVICHVLTLMFFNALKKLYFWQNQEEILNCLNFAG